MSGLKNNKIRWNDDLAQISWDEFEKLLAQYYSAQGFRVEHVGTGASTTKSKFDGGIDLKLYKDGKYTVVQCKHSKVMQIPHNDVHQLIGVMATEKADDSIIITSGEFTAAAIHAASKMERIELIDGTELRKRLKQSGISIAPSVSEIAWTASGASYEIEQVEHIDNARSRQTESAQSASNGLRGERRQSKRSQKKILGRLIFQIVIPILFLLIGLKYLPDFMVGLLKPITVAPQSAPIGSMPEPAPQTKPDSTHQVSGKPAVAEIAPAEQAMSTEELREWKKRNEESMKLLEESTPELAN